MNDLSPGLQDEYNRKYQQAFEILKEHTFIQGAGRDTVGFFGKKKLKEAVRLLTRCVEIVQDAWSAMWGIGKAHQALGNHLTALGWFERAVAIETGNPDVYREATIEAMGLGKAGKAVTYAQKACELVPDNAGLQANFALALLLDKKGERALETIKEACRRAPDDPVNKKVLTYINDVMVGIQPYPDRI
jgi:tetratricopeptide (TPR) repeat protein